MRSFIIVTVSGRKIPVSEQLYICEGELYRLASIFDAKEEPGSHWNSSYLTAVSLKDCRDGIVDPFDSGCHYVYRGLMKTLCKPFITNPLNEKK